MLRNTPILLSAVFLLAACPAADRAADPEVTIKDIPLSSVYTNTNQPKLKSIYSGIFKADSPESEARQALEQAMFKRKPKKPLVAVVRGDTIQQAVLASARLAAMKEFPEAPVGPTDGSTSKKYWVLVHLGIAHSNPPCWLLSRPQQADDRVRVSYTENDFWPADQGGTGVTLDGIPYLYWIPVDRPGEGAALSVELVSLKKTVEAKFPKK